LTSVFCEACREKRRVAPAASFLLLSGDIKKDVDGSEKSLHNLVSLLLMQQRRTRR
jgi:hypothetical protein